MNNPRISPLALQDWDSETRDALSILDPGKAKGQVSPPSDAPPAQRAVPNIIGIYARNPQLSRSWMTFSNHLRNSSLTEQMRELVILRTSWLRRGEYEWAQHVRIGRGAGLSDEQIQAVQEGPKARVWAPQEATVLRAVDEICEDRYISDTTWAELASDLDQKQLMDLVFTIGAFDMHCMAFNTFGLELDGELKGFDKS